MMQYSKNSGVRYFFQCLSVFTLIVLCMSILMIMTLSVISDIWLPFFGLYVVWAIPWAIAAIGYYKLFREGMPMKKYIRILAIIYLIILGLWTFYSGFVICVVVGMSNSIYRF